MFFLSVAYATKQEIEIYVDGAYEPFSYSDEKGEAKGVYIDILRTAFSRMESDNVKFTPIPWKRGQRISNVSGFDGWGGQAFRRLVEDVIR